MTEFICISGKAQHGKDTSAQILKEELDKLGKKVIIVHYADLLKFICKTYFGWDGNKDETGRTLLQRVGTDVVRAQEPDYWVDFVISIVRLFPDEWDYIIVPDCRFPNEIEALKKAGYPTTHIRVVRPNFDSGLTDEQKAHASEIALDNYSFDYALLNTSMSNLHSSIDNTIQKIIGKEVN